VGDRRDALAALTGGKKPVTHFTGGTMGPRAVLKDAQNFAPKGFRSPDLPAHSESLYRLSSPGPHNSSVMPARKQPTVCVCPYRCPVAVITERVRTVAKIIFKKYIFMFI
jgi:hypothetical protein